MSDYRIVTACRQSKVTIAQANRMSDKEAIEFNGYRCVTECRLCESTQLTEALNLGSTPLANELDGTELFPLIVNRCDDCGHHQLSIAVNSERLWGPNYPYQSGTSPIFCKHLEALADEVAALKPGGRVLEIASNDGTLCYALAERGLVACGIDPSGPDEYRGDIALIRDSWPMDHCDPADVILALNVFAHVDDLHGFTAAVKEALAPDGVFILEVGDLRSVVDAGLFDVIYHEHMSYHHVAPLVPFFRRHGLVLDRVQMVASQGGSIRCYVKHEGTDVYAGPTPVISKLLPRIAAMTAGVEEALENGGTIDGYGCPAKLTTLVFAGKIPLVDCIYDDNPLKVGKRVPGRWARILPTSELLKRNPDTLLLFSWNFADEIISRLRAQGYRGRIVVPLPEVKVYE